MGLLQRLFGKGETTPRAATSADDPGDAPGRPEAGWSPEAHPGMESAIAAREEAAVATPDEIELGLGGFVSRAPAPEYIPEAGQPTEQDWAEEEQRYKEREDSPPGT